MGLYVGNVPVKQVYVGSTPVTAVYVGAEKIWPTTEVYEVSLTNVMDGSHPLVSVTLPAGETWDVRIQGTVTKATAGSAYSPHFRIGVTDSGTYGPAAAVDFSGTVTAANSTIALVTDNVWGTSFTGTVTIEK